MRREKIRSRSSESRDIQTRLVKKISIIFYSFFSSEVSLLLSPHKNGPPVIITMMRGQAERREECIKKPNTISSFLPLMQWGLVLKMIFLFYPEEKIPSLISFLDLHLYDVPKSSNPEGELDERKRRWGMKWCRKRWRARSGELSWNRGRESVSRYHHLLLLALDLILSCPLHLFFPWSHCLLSQFSDRCLPFFRWA